MKFEPHLTFLIPRDVFILGTLAERFGAKWIFGCSLLTAGLLTLLSPIAARGGVGFLIALRILIGFFEV